MDKREQRVPGDNTVLRAAQWLYQHTKDEGFMSFVKGAPMECALIHFNKVMGEHEQT